MAMDIINRGGVTGNYQEVDANHNALVNLPTDGLQAGFAQMSFKRDATVTRAARITEEGEAYSAAARLLFYCDFNGATFLNNQWNSMATTMTIAHSAGFLRLNGGLVTTTNIGCAISTARTFTIEDGQVLRIKEKIRHTNGAQANKQFDFGLGMYVVAAAQAGAMIEFMGFRWTLTGELLGVLETSAGGAPTTNTVNINGGVPYSDAVTRTYEVVITTNAVEFWVNNVFQASIQMQNNAPCITKGAAYPVINRHYTGTATALEVSFDIGECAVTKLGPEADLPISYRQSLMGRHSAYAQSGLTGTGGNTATNTTNATAPTATAGTNAAAALTGLGGFFALTATNGGVANDNMIVCAYQNPVIPIAAGAATNSRNLIITGIRIGPLVVTTLFAGGGAVWTWWVSMGNTAVTQATTDSAGTTTIGTKSPRIIPLGIVDVLPATAAVAAVLARTGDGYFPLETPLVIHPGEFISVGIRVLQATAAITAGVVSGGVGFGGYWD